MTETPLERLLRVEAERAQLPKYQREPVVYPPPWVTQARLDEAELEAAAREPVWEWQLNLPLVR